MLEIICFQKISKAIFADLQMCHKPVFLQTALPRRATASCIYKVTMIGILKDLCSNLLSPQSHHHWFHQVQAAAGQEGFASGL